MQKWGEGHSFQRDIFLEAYGSFKCVMYCHVTSKYAFLKQNVIFLIRMCSFTRTYS